MMFMAALPLVFVTLAAIHLPPVAAQGKPVHHVLRGDLIICYGNASKSTLLYLSGYDNNGVERISTVYADETEGFQIKELHDDEGTLTGCEYTGKVHDGFYTVNPKPAHLKDNNCAIRNAPNVESTYSVNRTFEVVFDEGMIQYEVKVITPEKIEYLNFYVPPANQDSIFRVSNADLTVYLGGENSPTTMFLEGQDQNGVDRISIAHVEEIGGNIIEQFTSQQEGHVALCEYHTKVLDEAYSLDHTYASFVQSCAIKDAPKALKTYKVHKIFEVAIDFIKIQYKVKSVRFSTTDVLKKIEL